MAKSKETQELIEELDELKTIKSFEAILMRRGMVSNDDDFPHRIRYSHFDNLTGSMVATSDYVKLLEKYETLLNQQK